MSGVILSPQTPASAEIISFVQMIERLARDTSVDIERLDRLLAMRERENGRLAEQSWKAAMSAAQAEMEPVRVDSTNNQTNSRYASHAALDGAIREIYTGHGFGLTFDSGDAPLPDHVRIICDVSHPDGHSRRYHLDMPVDGKGARGGDVMTKTHAMGSGITYGKRYLLGMIFNLAVVKDDDGNAAGGKLPARIQRNLDRIAPRPEPAPAKAGGIAEKHPDSFPPGAAEQFATRPARTVVPAKPGGIADRAMVARAHQSWARPAGPSKAFSASDAGRRGGYDERNPPPHEDIPDHAAKALNRQLHPMNDGIPDFLDRRR
jgi:ERF superfamily